MRQTHLSTPQVGVRERTLEVVAGTSASTKLAAGIARVLLLAGGTIGAATITHPARYHNNPTHPVAVHPRRVAPIAPVRRGVPHTRAALQRSSRRLPRPSEQHTPGGFSYLGATPPPTPRPKDVPVVKQRGGSPFGP
jgi:hypothetical protein